MTSSGPDDDLHASMVRFEITRSSRFPSQGIAGSAGIHIVHGGGLTVPSIVEKGIVLVVVDDGDCNNPL